MTTIRLSNTLIAGDEIPLIYGDSIGIWKKYGINLVEQNVSTAIQYTGATKRQHLDDAVAAVDLHIDAELLDSL